MKTFKKLAAILAAVLLVSIGAVGCGGEEDGGGGGGSPSASIEYGELSIDNVTLYLNSAGYSTFAEITPVFSKPDMAEPLTYMYDSSALKIENGIVTASPSLRKDRTVGIFAESKHFSKLFTAEIKYIPVTGDDADAKYTEAESRFGGTVLSRAERCKAVTGDTTLFIGDSFMDDYFISEYMNGKDGGPGYAADKEVMYAGISSTTSYTWEAMYETLIGDTAPKNIVLHIGTNNFYDKGDTVRNTQESLTRLMMFMHTSYPTSNIYWFNITQRTDTLYNRPVRETNTFMAEWCSQYDWITCVDTCSRIQHHMLRDGIHVRTEYYHIFTDQLVNAGCEIVKK